MVPKQLLKLYEGNKVISARVHFTFFSEFCCNVRKTDSQRRGTKASTTHFLVPSNIDHKSYFFYIVVFFVSHFLLLLKNSLDLSEDVRVTWLGDGHDVGTVGLTACSTQVDVVSVVVENRRLAV